MLQSKKLEYAKMERLFRELPFSFSKAVGLVLEDLRQPETSNLNPRAGCLLKLQIGGPSPLPKEIIFVPWATAQKLFPDLDEIPVEAVGSEFAPPKLQPDQFADQDSISRLVEQVGLSPSRFPYGLSPGVLRPDCQDEELIV